MYHDHQFRTTTRGHKCHNLSFQVLVGFKAQQKVSQVRARFLILEVGFHYWYESTFMSQYCTLITLSTYFIKLDDYIN
jgi:hypothetical protein